jgi:hypothetical protein
MSLSHSFEVGRVSGAVVWRAIVAGLAVFWCLMGVSIWELVRLVGRVV